MNNIRGIHALNNVMYDTCIAGGKTYAYHLSQKQNNTVATTQSYLLQRNRNIPEKQHIKFNQIVQPNINFLSFLFPL